MDKLGRLQRQLGYEFSDQGLLRLALTHRSAGRPNNERLEFLGDSVINHVITEQLYRQFADSREGELSRMRSALVCGETLAQVARELQLDEYLKLGPGEMKSGAWRRDSIMADVFEAVLGAMLLDSSLEQCRERILLWFDSRLTNASPEQLGKDSKTRLQEFLQKRRKSLPEYTVVTVTGEGHDCRFEVACQVKEFNVCQLGHGSSRQKAEQEAALLVLEALQTDG